VNYIFHKLSVNTKHIKFWLCMSPHGQINVGNGYLAHFSCIYWGAPTCSHVAKTTQGLKGRVLRKKFVFVHKILVFHVFFFLFMVLHDITFNVTVTMQMWSFWFFWGNFTRSTMLKFWVKIVVKKNNITSLKITNMELRFELCVLNLIWKWGAKDSHKKKRLSNFY
jgi:hypothetical protein